MKTRLVNQTHAAINNLIPRIHRLCEQINAHIDLLLKVVIEKQEETVVRKIASSYKENKQLRS